MPELPEQVFESEHMRTLARTIATAALLVRKCTDSPKGRKELAIRMGAVLIDITTDPNWPLQPITSQPGE